MLLKKYVDNAIAEHAAPFFGQDRDSQFRENYELASDGDGEGEATDGVCDVTSDNDGSVDSRRGKHELHNSLALNAPLAPLRSPNVLSPPPTPPGSIRSLWSGGSPTSRRHTYEDGTRRRPLEFDGTVSWEAYRPQFELLASARRWSHPEMAMQLVLALKGSAL